MKKLTVLMSLLFTLALGIAAVAQTKADVIVVGSGGAGLSAAVMAAQSGAKNVMLIEKLSTIGGNTIMSGGSFNAPDPERQKLIGVEDSPELYWQQTLAAGDYRANPELVKVLAYEANPTMKWLESLGVKFSDVVFQPFGGLFPRGHNTGSVNVGRDYINVLNDNAKKLGVTVQTNTRAVRLVQDKDGRVTGVVATDRRGKEVTYEAKAVVLATGGFGANVDMRMRHDPRLNAKFRTTNNFTGKATVGNTGDGHMMAIEAGAYTVGMDYIQMIPFSGGRVTDYVGGDVYVNDNGKRFIDEGARRDDLTEALFVQPNQRMWVITDSQSTKGASFEGKLKSGVLKQANTVEDMAKQMGIDPKILKKTMDDYNKNAAKKVDPEFGRVMFTQTIDKAPFYFGIEEPEVHYTCGGVMINTNAQVLDINGKVIPGLYAAGEVTGGIHGTNRAGGNSLTDIMVFGRIAGKNAALEK